MARKHFNKNNEPNIGEITKEICGYIESLEINVTRGIYRTNEIGDIINPNGGELYADKLIIEDIHFVPPGPKRNPFKVNEIYIIESSFYFAEHFADVFYDGYHNDLKLLVKTNILSKVFSGKNSLNEISQKILDPLTEIFSKSKGEWIENYQIEIIDGNFNKLETPYKQIYPTIQETKLE